MDLTRLQKNLEALGYTYRYFPTAQAAAGYLTARLAGKTIGIGGSMSIDSLGL